MRKSISLIVLAIIVLSVVACGPTSRLNETNTLVATRVINAVDAYLDGGSLNSVRTVVEREMGNVDDSCDTAFLLSARLITLNAELFHSSVRGEDVEAIRGFRNGVAELAGIRNR